MSRADDDFHAGVPGVYAGIEHADYLAHPALSSSGARALLPPSCPARYRHDRTQPRPATDAMDIGSVAHWCILGTGPEIVEVEADSWRTNAAQQARKDARARGAVAVLTDDYQRAQHMAAAFRRHPLASALITPGEGLPEAVLVWQDGPVTCRAALDWLPDPRPSRRLIITDYKTTHSAHPDDIARTVATYRYHQQAAWYLAGTVALGIDDTPALVFVFQEKTPPYLITVVELDATALAVGRHRNRQAVDVYARCVADDHWPGYTDDVTTVSLPAWAERTALQEMTA